MPEQTQNPWSMFPNMNIDSGIHYGAISQNILDMSVMDAWYENDAIYDDALSEVKNDIQSLFEKIGIRDNDRDFETIREMMLNAFNENWQNDDPQWYYEDSEYSSQYSPSLNCWIITNSPYYTYTRQCSPCVPNAGDLDNPVYLSEIEREKNIRNLGKTYCLPKDFFDCHYAKIPYRYYRVSDDNEVIAPIIEVD